MILTRMVDLPEEVPVSFHKILTTASETFTDLIRNDFRSVSVSVSFP